MLSNLLELLGFASLVASVWVLAGFGWALLILAPCLWLVGLAADGLEPERRAREAVGIITRRAWLAYRRAHHKRNQTP